MCSATSRGCDVRCVHKWQGRDRPETKTGRTTHNRCVVPHRMCRTPPVPRERGAHQSTTTTTTPNDTAGKRERRRRRHRRWGEKGEGRGKRDRRTPRASLFAGGESGKREGREREREPSGWDAQIRNVGPKSCVSANCSGARRWLLFPHHRPVRSHSEPCYDRPSPI